MSLKSQIPRAVIVVTLTCLCGGAPSVRAFTPFLDQSQTTSDDIDRVGQTISLAQTFTPSVSGRFDHLMLWAGRQNDGESNPFVVSLASTQAGVPGSILGTVTQTSFISGVRSWYSYDFSSQGILLNAGVQYAFVLSCPGSFNGIGVGASMSDLYPGGSEFEQIGSNPWSSPNYPVTGNAGADLTFQTFMQPVPEPGFSSLALLGLLGLGVSRRLEQ